MFDAHSTMEPVIVARESAILTERDKPWHEARLPCWKRASATG